MQIVKSHRPLDYSILGLRGARWPEESTPVPGTGQGSVLRLLTDPLRTWLQRAAVPWPQIGPQATTMGSHCSVRAGWERRAGAAAAESGKGRFQVGRGLSSWPQGPDFQKGLEVSPSAWARPPTGSGTSQSARSLLGKGEWGTPVPKPPPTPPRGSSSTRIKSRPGSGGGKGPQSPRPSIKSAMLST